MSQYPEKYNEVNGHTDTFSFDCYSSHTSNCLATLSPPYPVRADARDVMINVRDIDGHASDIIEDNRKPKRSHCYCSWRCCGFTTLVLLGFLIIGSVIGVILFGRFPQLMGSSVQLIGFKTPDRIGFNQNQPTLQLQIDLVATAQIYSYSFFNYKIDRLNVSVRLAH
jgi:hypothetical protein